MTNQLLLRFILFSLLCLLSFIGCQKKEVNYIFYYQKVNEIDSIYRLARERKLAVEEYKKLFEEYELKNQERIIGTMGHDNTLFIIPTFLTHMIESKEYYPYIRSKLYEYVKSGDCVPRDYAMMVDMYQLDRFGKSYYSPASNYEIALSSIDSVRINRNRKSIGLPSLKHTAIIKKDFLKTK